ncbi:Elongation factor Ts [Buchnera aphidicola (Phyllaphis fagi)]|uniref:translation elongation factor Ts n=1 Tax=Buchnera aphidicola TaxID=9 RepID=UPI003464574E
MVNITSDLVKQLRFKTGSGIMDCKQALINSSGNIEKAIIYLRKMGSLTAEKKSFNSAILGVVLSKINGHVGYLIELNCETDFVAKHDEFINFAQEILMYSCTQNIKDLKLLKDIFEEKRILLVSKFNENIIIRRLHILEGQIVVSYMHGYRIGVLVSAKTSKDIMMIKQIAMHIAASKPDFLHSSDIPQLIIENEKKIQLDIVKNSGKSELISQKIVNGKIKKFINNITLLDQNFIMDPNKKVKDFLFENNIEIVKFIRFELGEIV